MTERGVEDGVVFFFKYSRICFVDFRERGSGKERQRERNVREIDVRNIGRLPPIHALTRD